MLRTRLALVASVLLLGACDVPKFQGPQIQNPPPAFYMNRDVTQARRMFPDHAVIFHEAWVETSWGNFSGIYINGHPGNLDKAAVEAALDKAKSDAAGERVEFGPLESLEIDGRTAWGWSEVWRLDDGIIRYGAFRAAVPYDTVTYAVDLLTGDPGIRNRPDSMRTVVAQFAVGRTRWNMPLLLIGGGALLLLLNLWRTKVRKRAARARHIPLVKIPKPATAGAAPGAARTEAPPAAPPFAGGGAVPHRPPGPPRAAPSSVADAIREKIGEDDPGPS